MREQVNNELGFKIKITTAAWNCDDTLIITAQINQLGTRVMSCPIKVWSSQDGSLIYVFEVAS